MKLKDFKRGDIVHFIFDNNFDNADIIAYCKGKGTYYENGAKAFADIVIIKQDDDTFDLDWELQDYQLDFIKSVKVLNRIHGYEKAKKWLLENHPEYFI